MKLESPYRYGTPSPEVWTGQVRTSIHSELKHPLRDVTATITSKTGAMKEALGKPPVSLVPTELILGAARAFAFGEQKYNRHNWRKGMKGSLLYDALMRHLLAWNDGEDNAEDSGVAHLDHAAACLAMLMSDLGHDDRYRQGVE